MDKHLHIICLDVPYPVDYGGVFDLFYKLPALQNLQVKIHLHCFEYGRVKQVELNKYCEEVHYYKRKTGVSGFTLKLPYIVSSRINETLLERLLRDDHPILMEGVHSTYLLNDERFASRKRFVRLHNVEHIYYAFLLRTSTSFFKKFYYGWESRKLFKYEKNIVRKAIFWSVTEKDAEDYRNLGCNNIELLPLFLPNWKAKIWEGKGTYCLYHGHLAVAENEKAATWLLQNVFNEINIPFVITGKNPSKELVALAEENNHTCLVANPSESDMQDMIQKAHINILPSFNNTGIKLKILNALYNGRFCLVNQPAVAGSGLEKLVCLASDAKTFQTMITTLFNKSFDVEMGVQREQILGKMFNNANNAKQMVKWIWGDEK